jgi:hypothetical protein
MLYIIVILLAVEIVLLLWTDSLAHSRFIVLLQAVERVERVVRAGKK